MGHFARADRLRKPVFFAALTVFYILAVIPTEILPDPMNINDKLAHSLTFMVLFFLMDMAYAQMPRGTMAAYLMAYGAFIEVTQYFIPYREFSVLDMVANAVGLSVYFLVWRWSFSFYKA
jgi:VanZ family protein